MHRADAVRRTLPLHTVRIATPCHAKWDDMIGDERVRFCGECSKNVYNLSAMTREEAEEVVAEHEGNLCARMFLREDGTVMTQDCPVGVRRKWVRRVASAAAGGALLTAQALSLASQRSQSTPGTPTTSAMGAVAVATPSVPVETVPVATTPSNVTLGVTAVEAELPTPPSPPPPAQPTPPTRPHVMGRIARPTPRPAMMGEVSVSPKMGKVACPTPQAGDPLAGTL